MVGISAAIGARCRLADRDMEVHLDSAEQRVAGHWPLFCNFSQLADPDNRRSDAGKNHPAADAAHIHAAWLDPDQGSRSSPATRIFMEHLRRTATTLRADARHCKTPSRRKSAEPTSV
jgi:hypothetical protein